MLRKCFDFEEQKTRVEALLGRTSRPTIRRSSDAHVVPARSTGNIPIDFDADKSRKPFSSRKASGTLPIASRLVGSCRVGARYSRTDRVRPGPGFLGLPNAERNDRCAVSYCGCWGSRSRLSFSSTSSTSCNRGGAALTFLPYAGKRGLVPPRFHLFAGSNADAREEILQGLLIAALVIAGLYFGREVLLPLALAILLSFVLTPPLLFLRRLKVPRVIGVSIVVTFAFVVIVTLGWLLSQQVTQLAGNLPSYRSAIVEKIGALRSSVGRLACLGEGE